MVLRNLLVSAILVGLVAGLFHGIFQALVTVPIITAAEQYEVAEEPVAQQDASTQTDSQESGHGHGGHEHGEGWAPDDGAERLFFTLFATVLVAISYATLVLALMVAHNVYSAKPPIRWQQGVLWGLVLAASVFIAPLIFGLHPEVPGTIAPDLHYRQFWWIVVALCTAAGFALMYYLPTVYKALGVILLLIPHWFRIDASQLKFQNVDAAAELTLLSGRFLWATGFGIVLFSLIVGVLCAYALPRVVGQLAPAQS